MNLRSVTLQLEALFKSKVIRYPIMLILMTIGLVFLFREAHHLKVNDFIRYWFSSRILLTGGDPYSSIGHLSIQEVLGPTLAHTCITYNPPWIFPLIIVFGLFSQPVSQILWLFTQIAVVLVCTNQIWRLFGGLPKQLWIAWLAAFTFGPAISTILFQGQISPLILAGLVGFLVFIDKPGKEWIAGALAVLVLVKPQVPYLFLVAFLLWIIFKNKWSALIGFITCFAILNFAVLIFNPHIFSQFFQCIQNNAPTGWATPTIGTYLRLLFNPSGFLLVFLPPLFGITWIFYYFFKNYRAWDWKREIPIILFISSITSAYIWTYDLIILIIPLLMAFIWLLTEKKSWIAVTSVIIYIVIDSVYLRLHLIYDDSIFIWFAPLIFIWYLVMHALHERSIKILEVNDIS